MRFIFNLFLYFHFSTTKSFENKDFVLYQDVTKCKILSFIFECILFILTDSDGVEEGSCSFLLPNE